MSQSADPLCRVTNVLFDLDGCLWFGGRVAPRAPEVVATLRARGYPVFFLTNASAANARGLAEKLTGLGIPADSAEVLAPLSVAHHHPVLATGARVLVVGKSVIGESLRAAGLPVVTSAEEAQVVVVGNNGGLTFADLIPALAALDRGASLLALNLDRRVPTEDGFAPGTGAIVAALETASGVKAEQVGKPSSFYFEQALNRFGVAAAESLMVGDSPESDVAGGRSAGMATVLLGDAPVSGEDQEPSLRVDHLEQLLDRLPARAEPALCH